MAGYWPSSCLFIDQEGTRSITSQKKKNEGNIQTSLTKQAWSIKDLLLICLFGKFFLWDTCTAGSLNHKTSS